MPPLNLARADRAARAAAAELRRQMPAAYPTDPAAVHRELTAKPWPASRGSWAIITRVEEGAEAILADAVRREREARRAQELAVEALRHLGAAAPSWARIGEVLGVSGQAAHKRHAARSEGPEPQTTIDELQEASAP